MFLVSSNKTDLSLYGSYIKFFSEKGTDVQLSIETGGKLMFLGFF